jgi:hypothetical protein
MTLREAIHLLPALPEEAQVVIVCPSKSIHVRHTQQFGYTITMSVVYEGVGEFKECECGELIVSTEKHLHTFARAEVEDTVQKWKGEDAVKDALLVVPLAYYEAEFPISL